MRLALLLLSLLLGWSGPVWAATPTVVQSFSAPYNQLGPVGAGATAKVTLPNSSLANNCLIVAVSWSGVTAISISDNVSGTTGWVQGPSIVTTGQLGVVFTKPGSAAGVTTLTISATAGTPAAPMSVHVSEWYNVATSAATDTSGANNSAPVGGVVSGPALTTATAGDLVYTFFSDTTATFNTAFTGVTAGGGSTPTLLRTSLYTGQISMYQLQAAAGAITPSMSVVGTTDAFNGLSIALKSATAGTAPTATPRIVGLQIDTVNSGLAAGATWSQSKMPCVGTTLLLAWDGEGTVSTAVDLTAVTDGNANTWMRAVNLNLTVSQATSQDIWYTTNATTSTTMTGPSMTIRGAGSLTFDSSYALYDVVGLNIAAPLDTTASTSGNQTVNGNLTTVSITPTTANGLVLFTTMIVSHTLSGCATPATCRFNAPVASSTDGNNDTWWEANGLASIYNPDTSTLTPVYTVQGSGVPAGVAGWGAIAAAFKAPGGGGGGSSGTRRSMQQLYVGQ